MYQPIPSAEADGVSTSRRRAVGAALAVAAVTMAVGSLMNRGGATEDASALADVPASKAAAAAGAAASAAAAVQIAAETTTVEELTFALSNEYTDANGPTAARYPWLADGSILLAEPFKPHTLAVGSSGDDNLEYAWTLTAPVGSPVADVALSGASAVHVFDFPGTWQLSLEEKTKANQKVKRSVSATVMVKYVRREIRQLTDDDREKFFSTMEVAMNTPTDSGRELYGPRYKSVEDFAKLHNELSGHRTCDHMHGGLGFLPQHAAMTYDFELSLQSVDPSVSMVYWDYTIESHHMSTTTGHINAWYDSIVFDDAWWGPVGSDATKTEVSTGRFAYHKIASLKNESGATTNAYGLMRSPWNQNNNPYLTRHSKSYGFSLSTSIVPTCDDFYTQMGQKIWSGFGASAQYAPHGSLHILIGGVWGADFMEKLVTEWGYPYVQAQPLATLTLARIWRKHWMECPGYCSSDTPAANCTCSCTHLERWQEEGHHTEHKMIVNMYPSVARSPDFLTSSDGTDMTDSMLRLFCSDYSSIAPQIGDFMESASPSDPIFWPTHPTLDRMWQWRMINGMDDMSWTSTSCWGHNEEDVTVWHEDFDSENDKRYTNADLMVLFDPTNSSVPYVYADFEWSHCAEEGYPSDLMITDETVDAGSSSSRATDGNEGLPGGGQGHASGDDDTATDDASDDSADPVAAEMTRALAANFAETTRLAKARGLPPLGAWW
jgi:hypothetical protein